MGFVGQLSDTGNSTYILVSTLNTAHTRGETSVFVWKTISSLNLKLLIFWKAYHRFLRFEFLKFIIWEILNFYHPCIGAFLICQIKQDFYALNLK